MVVATKVGQRKLELSVARPAASIWTAAGATLVLVAIYLGVAAVLPAGGFYIGDQGVKFVQVDALARTATLGVGDLTQPLNVFRPAFNGVFYYEVGSRYQAIFSPAYAAVVAPFYRAFGMWGVVVPSVLGSALSAYAAALVGGLVGVRRHWALALLAGLATPMLFYALVLWEHALSAGLLAASAYLALRRKPLLAGLVAATAVWFRPEAYLFGMATVVAALVTLGARRGIGQAFRYSVGFAIGAAPWWVYNVLTVGSPLGLSARTAYGRTEGGVPLDSHVLLGRFNQLMLYVLPIGIKKWAVLLALMAVVGLVLYIRRRSPRPVLWLAWIGAAVIGTTQLLTAAAPPHSVTDGFPFTLAILAPAVLATRDWRVRFLLTTVAVYLAGALISTAADPDNHFGGEWGPRYLLPMFPLIAAVAWLAWERSHRRIERFALSVLLAYSLGLQVIGVAHLDWQEERWAHLNAELADLQPNVVATAVWWLPQIGAPTLSQVRWYGVADAGELGQLADVTDSFWWIWTSEEPDTFVERKLQVTGDLPPTRFAPVASRDLSTGGLHAVLYRVVR